MSVGNVCWITILLKESPSPCVQDEALSLSVPRRRRRRRKVEIEAERAAKRRNLMEMVAQLRESHASDDQAHAMDLTKALHGLPPPSSSFSGLASSSSSAVLKAQMELLQAGTPGRPRANGSLLDVELPTRRRRGRRKNVEGLELLFMGNRRTAESAVSTTGYPHPPISTLLLLSRLLNLSL